jgi:hypothetical protein
MLLTSHRCELSCPDGDWSGGEPSGGVEEPAGEGSAGIRAVGGSAGRPPAPGVPWGDSPLIALYTYSEGCVGGSSAPISQKMGMKIPITNMIQ